MRDTRHRSIMKSAKASSIARDEGILIIGSADQVPVDLSDSRIRHNLQSSFFCKLLILRSRKSTSDRLAGWPSLSRRGSWGYKNLMYAASNVHKMGTLF